MNKFAAVLLILLLAVFYIYFIGTPFVARVTGIDPHLISLIAGIAAVVLGATSIAFARMWSARRGRVGE